MPALTDFYARVARVIRRGNVYDADIPLYVADAVKTLEGLHNWRHMWRESFQQTLPAADSQIIFVGNVKGVRYLRFCVAVNSGLPLAGRFAYAKKSQPEDITSGFTLTSLAKARFWMTSPQVLQLNGAFTTDVLYDLGWYQRSVIDDNLPWIAAGTPLDSGILLAQTLIEMAPLLRDEKQLARNEAVLQRKLIAASESDLIHQFDSDDSEMTPFFEEMQDNLFSEDEGGLP